MITTMSQHSARPEPTWRERNHAKVEAHRTLAPHREVHKLFSDITFDGDQILCKKQGGGPITGARAHVDTAGDIDRRVTATRLILTGPFAFGLRKKKDTRELYLLVEGTGFAFVLPVDPKHGLEARQAAAAITAMGSSAAY